MASKIEDWKYQISLELPEELPDGILSNIYDIVDAAIATERERCAVIAETTWALVSVGKVTIENQAAVERLRIATAIRNRSGNNQNAHRFR